MTIHPEALKAARTKFGLSQKDLAERCSQPSKRNISPKAIYRYERGETAPSPKKAQWLAEGLGTTVDELSKEPGDEAKSEAMLHKEGYRRFKVLLEPNVRRNYRLVMHHYAVSLSDLVDAAPWMFTLLAEMSLTDRRQRLAEANTTFEAAMKLLPDHLGHGQMAHTDFDNAYEDEQASIASRDIFGNAILEGDCLGVDPFDPDATNPFVEFLRRKALETGSDEIDAEACEMNFGSGLPEWPVFAAWFRGLTDGNWLAEHAIMNGRVKLGEIPPDLMGAEKRADRVAWLVDQIPADERVQMVEEREKRLLKIHL